MAPRWAKIGPRQAKMGPSWRQAGPKMAPRWSLDGPRWRQDVPRWRLQGLKNRRFPIGFCTFSYIFVHGRDLWQDTRKMAPRSAEIGHRWPKIGPSWRQDGSEMAPRCPRWRQDGPKMGPRWRQHALSRPHTTAHQGGVAGDAPQALSIRPPPLGSGRDKIGQFLKLVN